MSIAFSKFFQIFCTPSQLSQNPYTARIIPSVLPDKLQTTKRQTLLFFQHASVSPSTPLPGKPKTHPKSLIFPVFITHFCRSFPLIALHNIKLLLCLQLVIHIIHTFFHTRFPAYYRSFFTYPQLFPPLFQPIIYQNPPALCLHNTFSSRLCTPWSCLLHVKRADLSQPFWISRLA